MVKLCKTLYRGYGYLAGVSKNCQRARKRVPRGVSAVAVPVAPPVGQIRAIERRLSAHARLIVVSDVTAVI